MARVVLFHISGYKLTMAQAHGRFPQLREFVKEMEQKIYDFCFYMLGGGKEIDDVVIGIFREFGDYYRRGGAKKSQSVGGPELRTALFRLAWRQVRDAAVPAVVWVSGRDTRNNKNWDSDLLASISKKDDDAWRLAVTERLRLLDLEFRAPLVLRDVLRLEDEEAVRVLGLRWGVYRHRLHRGRVDFRECLIGGRSAAEIRTQAGR